jgi:hypothetical protein
MSSLPVKADFPYDRTGSWGQFNPFQINFVYPITGKPFLIKGGRKDLKKWIEDNLTCSYVMYETIWEGGKNRTYHAEIVLLGDYKGHMHTHQVEKWGRDAGGYAFNYKVVDGWYMAVYRRDSVDNEMKKFIKRPPRCFPEEFVMYCDDRNLYRRKRSSKKNRSKKIQEPRVEHTAEDFMVMSDALDAVGL